MNRTEKQPVSEGAHPWEDEIRAQLSYCPESGQLTWRVSRQGVSAGSRAGCLCKDGRVRVKVRGRLCFAHRVAWLLATGSWPKQQIDHMDGDPSNNRLANLRDVSGKVNSQNVRKVRARSGLLGASWDPITERYVARLQVDGRQLNLGRFATAQEAHAAYVAAKRIHHEGCTL